MPLSADILVHNVLGLGSMLVILILAAFMLSRGVLALAGPLLRRVDPSGALNARWTRVVSRGIILATSLLSLALLGGAVLLTWYEQDFIAYAEAWIERLFTDPLALAWLAAEMLGVLLAAGTIYFILSGLVRVVCEGFVARVPRHAPQLELLLTRLRAALRWTLALGAVNMVLERSEVSAIVRDPVASVTFIVVGFVVARAAAAAAHLAADMLAERASALSGRDTPLRFFGRLDGIVEVTKRALDYFIYVGAATLVCELLTPDTALAGLGLVALRVIAIIYVCRVFVELCEVALRQLFSGDAGKGEAEQHLRATLIPVATSVIRYITYIFGVAMAASELGLDTTPLLATAGLIGIAVGLGAQEIVSDLVSGFFILFEGIFLVGHRVQIGEVIGFVEEIGVRVTKVRDESGVLHCIPNGEIRTVASSSAQYVNAVTEFGVPYGVDFPQVFNDIKAHLDSVRANYSDILDDTVLIIEELREQCIWMRTETRVKPGRDDDMSEALRIEVIAALAAAKVAPPHQRRVIELTPALMRKIAAIE